MLWTLELNNLLSAPPAFENLHAFFPIEGDRIVAYDLVCGDQMWIASIVTTTKPAASPELLFVAEVNQIDALKVTDGSRAWQTPLASPVAAPLVWDNGWLLAATSDGAVLALRASDGHLVWRSEEVGSPAHASPSLAGDRVYVPTEDGRVVTLRLDNGAREREYRLGGAANEILVLGDRLYVGSKDNFFYCLKSGELDWHWRTGGDVIGMPVVDEHNVYFVSLDNLLRAVNRVSGNQRWKRTLPIRPTTGPIKAGNLLIVTGLGHTLPTFTMLEGSPAGDVPITGDVASAPHVTSIPGIFGTVFIAVSSDIAKGATVAAYARTIEPDAPASIAPLPHPVTPDGVPIVTTTTIPKL